jgi:hypothetical protein
VSVWKVILVAMLIFGCGVITGGIVARRPQQPVLPSVARPAETNRAAHFNRPDQARRFDFILRAQRELQLTPEQRDQVEGIVREGQEQMRAMWDEFNPRMQTHLREVREQINDVLTPEQRERFAELMKQRRPPRPDEGKPHDGLGGGPPREPLDPPRPLPPN